MFARSSEVTVLGKKGIIFLGSVEQRGKKVTYGKSGGTIG